MLKRPVFLMCMINTLINKEYVILIVAAPKGAAFSMFYSEITVRKFRAIAPFLLTKHEKTWR